MARRLAMDMAGPRWEARWGSMTAAEGARERARNGRSKGDHGEHGGDVHAEVKRAPQPPQDSKPRWYRLTDLVDTISAHAQEPWAKITLGGEVLIEIRAGGIMIVMGHTGGGKTSLICSFLIEYARNQGPVIVLSRELPADEFSARTIGIQADASWPDVLKGKLAPDDMRRHVDLPVFIADRRNATIGVLEEMIKVAQTEHPGKLPLVVVDYLQIIESAEKDPRAKVADVVARIDDALRADRCVGILISQMSRNASRESRNGERVGADSTDGGAESAAIERAATVTLAIGKSGPEREDGSYTVELSIGKHRMGGGDKVFPTEYVGRTGRWRITGPARPATVVKAERDAANEDLKLRNAKLSIEGAARKADEAQTRSGLGKLAGVTNAATRTAAINALLEDGDLVEVRIRTNKHGPLAWKVWNRERAMAAGVAIVERDKPAGGAGGAP